jgi:hypothetical protein
MKSRSLGLLLLAIAPCGFAIPAHAQTDARLTGVVRSSAGKAIPGAKVTAAGQNRNQQQEAVCADDGTFSLAQLAPDTYQVAATASGYSDSSVVLELGAGQARTIELKLNDINDSTLIAVSKDAAAADLSSARLSVNVTPAELSAMPLNGRSYSILTLFAPGAVNRGDGGFDKLSFGGRPTSDNRYNFDGMDAGSVIDPNPGWFPVVGTQFRIQTSIETIQEFRVDSALQTAEYGLGAGGHVNLVSRAGGSEFHGSIYENFRHDRLAARDFFAAGDSSRLRMSQYGGAAGGPIPALFGKERAFFFVAFERLSESSDVTGQGVAPTPLLLAVIHPASKRILSVLPVAHSDDPAALIGLATRSGMSRLDEWNASARLDFNLTDTQRFAVRYVKARQSLDTLDQTTVTPRFMLAHAAPDNGMVSWNGMFGTIFQELKFGLNRAPTGLAYVTPYDWLNEISVSPGAQLPTWMFGAVGRQAGGEYGRASDYRSRSYSLMDTLSWSWGRHNLKGGFELRAVRVPVSMLGGTIYSFSTPGFMANLGATVSYLGDLKAEARQSLFAGFLQDEWRLRRDMTLNFGLRYEFYTPVSEGDGRARVFDMSRLDYLPTGSAFYRAEKLGLAPRLAIAWAPLALGSKTIFRAGGAVHYGPGAMRNLLGPVQNAATRISADGLSFPADLETAAAAGRTVENPAGIDSSSGFPGRVIQWGLSVQQVLPARFTAQAGYLGSGGRNLLTNRWGNFVTGMSPYGQLIRQNPSFGEIAYVAAGGSDNYHAMQLQLSRRFTDDFVAGVQYSWSHSITDVPSDGVALQNPKCLRCEKGAADFDARHSATFNGLYRVPLGRGSRHLSGGIAGSVFEGWSIGAVMSARTGLPVNVTLQRSDLAFFNQDGVMVQLGTPGALPALDTPLGGATRGSMRPDAAAGVDPYFDQRLLVFNPAAFRVPLPGSYGNLARNSLRGPGFAQLDSQITRTFRFGERGALEFRADFYNLLNHADFAQPSSTLINVSPFIQPGGVFSMDQASNFGVISSTIGRNLGLGTSRQIQLGLRLGF